LPSSVSDAGLTAIDAALRLIDREVWVITAAAGKRRGGLVATWVSAASIDRERPVLMAGVAPNHFTAELIDASGVFAAHLLRPDQPDLAWNFARDSGRDRDKLADFATQCARQGPPILVDCLAWYDCRVFNRYDAGDRLFYWADVVAAEVAAKLRVPSLASGTSLTGDDTRSVPAALRERAFISALTADQRQVLAADRAADIAVQSPRHARWRAGAANLSGPPAS
jgi:flavin reductase (DIM6/NTAB) family NADH-FMN oxidoreductase RutF